MKLNSELQIFNFTLKKLFQNCTQHKVKANALFYAVFVSVIIGVICGSLLFVLQFHKYQINQSLIETKLKNNCHSGINLILGTGTEDPGEQVVDLFGQGTDSVILKRKPWGVYTIGYSKAVQGSKERNKCALIGSNFNKQDQFSLYLAKQKKPLSLCGRVNLEGVCYLPESGVKRAYIEGQSYVGSQLVKGEIRKSTDQFPALNKEILDFLISKLDGDFTTDSVVEISSQGLPEYAQRSFGDLTKVFVSDASFQVTDQTLSGNIVLWSAGRITITREASLNDVVCFAREIEVEDGFQGSLQVFARDSIYIGKKVELEFPSVLGCISKGGDKIPELVIDEKSTISGSVFTYQELVSRKMSTIRINKDVIVNGLVYTNGVVDHKGSVNGTLICKKFVLKTRSSVYENHLLNADVSSLRLSPNFCVGRLLSEMNNSIVAKWLF